MKPNANTRPILLVAGILLALGGTDSWAGTWNPTASDANNNTAGGTDALWALPSGTMNTGFGVQALHSDTTGFNNTATGAFALQANTIGTGNTANGAGALQFNISGHLNTAIGSITLFSNTTGQSNTAIGSSALNANISGSYNAAIGTGALNKNNTGVGNTASGANAMYSNTSGGYNAANGINALNRNTTGSYNVASGSAPLFYNTTGSYNIASGNRALYANTTGWFNTAIGYNTLPASTTGHYNVALGYQAGLNLTSGSNNIYLGNLGVASESFTMRLGGAQTATFIAGVRGVTLDAATSVPVYVNSQGQLGTLPSSQRFKEDVRDMGEASRRLYELRPVTFRYTGQGVPEYGLIAEEVAKVYPDLAAHGADGKIEAVQYHKLTPMLLNEVQRLNRLLQKEKDKNATQEALLKAQAQETAELKRQVSLVQAQARRMEALAAKVAELENRQDAKTVAVSFWK